MSVTLGWGLGTAVPDNTAAAWGARLIWPADLVHDRQDMVGGDDERKQLAAWLNGGALRQALDRLNRRAITDWRPDYNGTVTIHEDGRGRIVGSPRASHGYVYLAAWLFEHEPQTEPQFKPGDRFFTHYDMQWGTVVSASHTYRGQTHGVTGDRLPDTTWYEVRYDNGHTSTLDDAHGNWDMARMVPPAVAERYGYGSDPKVTA